MMPNQDLVSALLSSMRVSASLLFSERYQPPWSVQLPPSADLAATFGFSHDTHVAAFHLIQQGEIHIELNTGEVFHAFAGDVAILFHGAAHRVWSGEGAPTYSVKDLLSGRHPAAVDASTVAPSSPSPTRLVCGAFTMRFATLNPLLSALPAVAILSFCDPIKGRWLSTVGAQLIEELEQPSAGSSYVVDRLLELFCAASVRDYMASRAPREGSWFAGLHDDVVRRALDAIHETPAARWTVDELAKTANTSRSRLSERFTRALGEPPMQYLAKWRMNTATRRLTLTKDPVQRIANDVGYESVAAFSRAFKQHLGVPPAQYRYDSIQQGDDG